MDLAHFRLTVSSDARKCFNYTPFVQADGTKKEEVERQVAEPLT